MAISSSFGTLYLAAADWNSLFKEVIVRARTRPLALPSKTAPASPVPLNLRKSRRCILESILELGFTSSGVAPNHSEHTFPLLLSKWLACYPQRNVRTRQNASPREKRTAFG